MMVRANHPSTHVFFQRGAEQRIWITDNTTGSAGALREDADREVFFKSETHKEALALMLYGIRERKGYTVIFGEQGMERPRSSGRRWVSSTNGRRLS